LLLVSLLQKEVINRWDANLISAHRWVADRVTTKLIKEAYAAHKIEYLDDIELAAKMKQVDLDEPPIKRNRL
jgi:hypothetical protein